MAPSTLPEFKPGISLSYEHRTNSPDSNKLQIGERSSNAEPIFQGLVLRKLGLTQSSRPRTIIYTETTRSVPLPPEAAKLRETGKPVPTLRFGMGFMQLTPDKFIVLTTEQKFASKVEALSSLENTMEIGDIKIGGTLEKYRIPTEVLIAYEAKANGKTLLGQKSDPRDDRAAKLKALDLC